MVTMFKKKKECLLKEADDTKDNLSNFDFVSENKPSNNLVTFTESGIIFVPMQPVPLLVA